MLYLKPNFIKCYGKGKYITPNTKIICEDPVIEKLWRTNIDCRNSLGDNS